MQPAATFVFAGGHRLECLEYPAHQLNRPPLVFLHEGLGCISMWRDFPARVAHATGCRTLVYSRYGYGQSDILEASHGADFMHREALQALPELLAALDIERPVLVGHSDGGSVALIYAGADRGPLSGVITMAAHVFVEDLTMASVAAAKLAFETTDLPAKLARHHRDVEKTFRGWTDIWLDPRLSAWNIEEYLARITCPLLAIQGVDDEYGTVKQVEAIAAHVPHSRQLLLPDCRHVPQRDQPDETLAAIVEFIDSLRG